MIRIKVFENTDPVLTFHLKKRVPGPNLTEPYILTAVSEIEFLGKDDPDDVDGDATITRSMTGGAITIVDEGSDPDDKYSVITVALLAADLATPKTHYFFVRVTKAGKKEIVANGYLEVQNI